MKKLLQRLITTPVYPLLFAAFSVLDYTTNHVADAQPPALAGTIVTVSVIVIIWAIIFVWIKDRHRRGLATWVLSLIFLSYDQLQASLESNAHYHLLTHYHVQLLGTIVFVLLFLGLMIKIKKTPEFVTGMLTLAGIYLVVTGSYHVWQAAQKQRAALAYVKPTIPTLKSGPDQPDIFSIMLEEYTGPVGLKQLYSYDDQSFVDGLKQRGFYVADQATANYVGSLHSLSSSLNLNYLDKVTSVIPGHIDQHAVMVDLVENNAVGAALQKAGYEYDHVGSWWEETRTNYTADHNLSIHPAWLPLPNLAVYYLTDQTMVGSFVSRLWPIFKRHVLAYQLTELPRLAAQTNTKPKFVFAHLLMPHRPIMYGKNCRELPVAETRDAGGAEKYLAQVSCANQLTLTLIDDIQKKAKKPPIIIVQSDEGQELLPDESSDLASWSDQRLLERLPIVSAVYYPNHHYDALYPSITSVNTFRTLFNTYFGTNLPLVSDTNLLLPNYYTFDGQVDVTNRMRKLLSINSGKQTTN